jgi:hypothetical protein
MYSWGRVRVRGDSSGEDGRSKMEDGDGRPSILDVPSSILAFEETPLTPALSP